MSQYTRRQFMTFSARLAAAMGLGFSAVPEIANALETIAAGATPVLWIQAQTCTGCSVSILNADQPGPASILTQYISLRFHQTLSAASGELSLHVLDKTIEEGKYLLVVEGTIPAGMPKACVVGEETIAQQITRAAKNAQAIIALGTCASFGGIPAAENNPTGAITLPAFLKKQSIDKPLIALPGCPPHPDWLVGTLVHVLKFGLPALDAELRPKMFYSKLLHDQCPRFPDYERENFAKTFGDEGCLFKLGCLGVTTHSDCTLRNFNSGMSNCIKAGAPCIGCAGKEFASRVSFPLFRKGEAEQATVIKQKA